MLANDQAVLQTPEIVLAEAAMGAVTPTKVQPRALATLAASPQYELRKVLAEQHGAALVLRGTVSSCFHKQLAREVVRPVCKETELINAIRVR